LHPAFRAGRAVVPSGRESFSPDASFYDGPMPADEMRFIEGAPTLAVEVRSENAYGDAAEAELADKRADCFQAGTAAV
jgi:Uma2 family endonuclease